MRQTDKQTDEQTNRRTSPLREAPVFASGSFKSCSTMHNKPRRWQHFTDILQFLHIRQVSLRGKTLLHFCPRNVDIGPILPRI